jgi:hypothetical protein
MATQATLSETTGLVAFRKMLMNMPPAQGTSGQLRSSILRTWALMDEYASGDGHDKGLAWSVFVRKEEERQAWLQMAPPRYVGAAACSLVREHLALELGHTHALAGLCEKTDDELEKARPCAIKTDLLCARAAHRPHFETMAPEVQVCTYWQCSALVVPPLLFGEAEDEMPAKDEVLACAGCGAAYCGRACQSQDMAHFEEKGAACKARKAAQAQNDKKKSATRRAVKRAFDLNPILRGMLRSGLTRQVFAAPAPVPPLEQVAAWLVKAWEKAPVLELYARMQRGGDFDGVGVAVVREAMEAGRLTAAVLASKGMYVQLHAAWKQRVLELYELQVTWMQWGARAHGMGKLA